MVTDLGLEFAIMTRTAERYFKIHAAGAFSFESNAQTFRHSL